MHDHENTLTIERKNYQPPSHWFSRVDLQFDLDPNQTIVTTELHFSANQNRENGNVPLRLDGQALELRSIAVNGVELPRAAYLIDDSGITFNTLPQTGILRTVVSISPALNTRLEGVYVSKGNFFTQCEAQGFRRITYFPDRPDVMAKFVVTLRAERSKCPVLLSNGNLIAEGDLDNGRHYAVWEDPFPKPCYLFALVAGNLVCNQKTIIRASGKPALLQVWVEPGQLENTGHAMQSLIKSIRWDESRFGLELDLDRFMIVAVGDFNMGAMENKGLNIFNSKFVLANPSIATDVDYDNIESIVGHEYFHNWTGNRVTCRDWFQLSLKEGLTVFRDQEFSADMLAAGLSPLAVNSARAVKRIDDVKVLRAAQFPEDAGPMAHPIRPDSYVEINNFYTVTVYEKGAEVVRMLQTLLGQQVFRRGMDIYFERHDGQAVTCDDFVSAMQTALQEKYPNRDLGQFQRWYSQAGTPHVGCAGVYDAEHKIYRLTLTQSCPATPGQVTKQPFHIPFALGLLGTDGHDIALHGAGIAAGETTAVLNLTETTQTFVFEDVLTPPVPSLLRGFSAPVIVQAKQGNDDLIFQLTHDSDAFGRWEAGQRLFARIILDQVASLQAEVTLSTSVLSAVARLIDNPDLSPAYRALVLQMPSEVTLAEQMSGSVDPTVIHAARQSVRKALGLHFQHEWLKIIETHNILEEYTPSSEHMGIRSLRGLALSILCDARIAEGICWAQDIFANANNMTERLASLTALVHSNHDAGHAALKQFEADWSENSLVLDKWFTVQATSPDAASGSTLSKVKTLLGHPQFSFKNPNKVRALVSSFCHSNAAAFHAEDGSGYTFWADMVIKLDPINPQVAARLARAMERWQRFTPKRQLLMLEALTRVNNQELLSPDVSEVAQKALGVV